jgi:hypothetical protein
MRMVLAASCFDQNKAVTGLMPANMIEDTGRCIAKTEELFAKYPGSYKNAAGAELTIVASGARLTIGQAGAPPAQRLTLVATGEKAFKAIGAPITVMFTTEGDKVASLTLTQPGPPPTVFTRVEGK